jgi:hypothetical protein
MGKPCEDQIGAVSIQQVHAGEKPRFPPWSGFQVCAAPLIWHIREFGAERARSEGIPLVIRYRLDDLGWHQSDLLAGDCANADCHHVADRSGQILRKSLERRQVLDNSSVPQAYEASR